MHRARAHHREPRGGRWRGGAADAHAPPGWVPVPQRVGCWGGGPGRSPWARGHVSPMETEPLANVNPSLASHASTGCEHGTQSATSHGCPPRTLAVPQRSSPCPLPASPAPSPAPTCCPSGCRHPRALWRSLCSWRARTSPRPRAPPAPSPRLSRRRCRRSRSGWEKARGEHGAVRFRVLGRQNCAGGHRTPPAPAAYVPWHGQNPIPWSCSISRGATCMHTAQPAC